MNRCPIHLPIFVRLSVQPFDSLTACYGIIGGSITATTPGPSSTSAAHLHMSVSATSQSETIVTRTTEGMLYALPWLSPQMCM